MEVRLNPIDKVIMTTPEMIEFKEVKGRKQMQEKERTLVVKRMCAYLEEKGDGTKIGGMIKNDLPQIRKDAGGATYVSYKTAEEAKGIQEWLDEHEDLARMEDMGAGWYIWSYKPEVTLKVKGELKRASEKRDAKQRAWERRTDRTPTMVSGPPRQATRRTTGTIPKESEFPATLGEGRASVPGGAWKEKSDEVMKEGEMVEVKQRVKTVVPRKDRVVMVDGAMPGLNEVQKLTQPESGGALNAAQKVSAWDE